MHGVLLWYFLYTRTRWIHETDLSIIFFVFGWLAPWMISIMKDMAKSTVIKSEQNTIKLKNHFPYSPGSSVYNSIVSCGFQCDRWTQLLSNKIQLFLLNNGGSRAFIRLLRISHQDEVCQTNLWIQHFFSHGNVYTSSPHGTNLWPRLPWTSVLVKSICTRIPLSTHTHTHHHQGRWWAQPN